jgi:hypothetical protein
MRLGVLYPCVKKKGMPSAWCAPTIKGVARAVCIIVRGMKYDTDALLRAVVLEEPIVAGPSGSVFHARLMERDGHKRRCVIKLPLAARKRMACPIPLSAALDKGIAAGGLRVEARNALVTLNAPASYALRSGHQRGALKRWQAQPGYTHLHPVVHFDARIPMLISLGADGTIAELRERLDGQTSPGPIWMRIAWQLSEAMAFLFEKVRLAHVDIQPKHVLFLRYGDHKRRLHCWLSDYGDLCPVDGTADVFARGDDAYKPLVRLAGARHREHSLFAYYATLLDLLLFRVGGTQAEETHITGAGHSVSGFLSWLVEEEEEEEAPDQRSDLMDRLQHNAQHPLVQMVLRPLQGPLWQCHAHFYEEMRPWLERTLRAGLSPI